ncbi:MAG: phage tail protein [Nitrospira sp.]|jgi:phage tail-like protein|nr:phage tail protein [Nitrospira sp.]
MPEREFKLQTLRTPSQWNAGAHTRLRIDNEGVELFSAPDFDRILFPATASDIAVSAQSELFWAELKGEVWQLIRFHPSSCRVEMLLALSSYGVNSPTRLWWTRRHLWVLDSPSGRILGFSLGSFQVTREIQVPGNLIDADIVSGPGVETVYALVESQGTFAVWIYPAPPGQESSVTSCLMRQPAALAAAKDGRIVILDTLLERFLRLENDQISCLGENRQPELQNLKPVAMEIDPSRAIYLASTRGKLKLFDPDGAFLMDVKLPSAITSIGGMGFDAHGGFYLASNAGIAVFARLKVPVGLAGTLYLPVLDNGKIDGTWHGVSLTGQLPAKSGIEIAYYASNDEDLKANYIRKLQSSASGESVATDIESLMERHWRIDTGRFTGGGTAKRQLDMAFVANKGRYLWLRLSITAYDAASHPSVTQVQVRYPRISLLRYLPSVYQEEPGSAAFLERFLALFETVFQEVDITITDLYQYFDPATTSPEFLSWLASWLSLSLDDSLPEDRKRALIAQSPLLFRDKGTPAGIRNFLSLYTGSSVEVREPSLLANPFTTGQIKLGEESILASRSAGALRVGSDMVLGEALLVPTTATRSAPLASVANRFEILLDMEPAQLAEKETAIRRAIRSAVPASTDWTVRLAPSQLGLGSARLEINARVASSQPFRVGVSPLGSGQALGLGFGRDIPAPRLERGAAVTPDWRLVE